MNTPTRHLRLVHNPSRLPLYALRVEDTAAPVAPPYAYDEPPADDEPLPLSTRARIQLALLIGAWVVVFLLFLALSAAAYASPVCGPREDILKTAAERFGEFPLLELDGVTSVAGTRTSDGGSMTLTVNPETRAWTLLTVGPNGTACVTATGEGVLPGLAMGEPS